jgi:hypothetical protein
MTDFWRMMTFISSGGGRQGPGPKEISPSLFFYKIIKILFFFKYFF